MKFIFPSPAIGVVLLLLLSGCASTQPTPELKPCPQIIDLGALQKSKTVDEVDTPPELIGGLRGMVENINYPKSAKRDKVGGVVLVRFVVNEEGCVTFSEVAEYVDKRLDDEALRVVKIARFVPGELAGNPVSVVMEIPVTFKVK